MRVLALAVLFVAAAISFLALPSLAQVGQGLHGPHYNLNIIGVPNDKNPDMTGNNGHRIFVPLDAKVKIYFVAGDEFRVLDANATDGEGWIEVPHGDPGTVCYDAFAVGLGKPGGNAWVDAEVIFDESTHDVLLALDQVSFHVGRNAGKPSRQNISDIFRVSGCIDLNDSGVCDAGDEFFTNEWVFNVDELLSYWWNYDNDHLKVMQVRFYECSLGLGSLNARVPMTNAEAGLRLFPTSAPSQSVQRISYNLPADSKVRLSVFDVNGRLVTRLVDSFESAGIHDVEWNAAGQPNGVYFYRLETGQEMRTAKVHLVR
jgi:hypothetical protein